MSATLAAQRCLRHPLREAVARCPQCAHSFCRECITEHEDRVLCADCLAKALRRTEEKQSFLSHVGGLTLGIIGIATAWLFFYCLGELLARAPASFHDGTVWEAVRPDDE